MELIDVENKNKSTGSLYFNDEKVSVDTVMRLGFIRKVYGILTCQLLVTVVFVLLSLNSVSFSNYQKNSWGIFILCLLLTIILPIVIVCCKGTMATVPKNYIILGMFTFAESYLVSYICSNTDPSIVLMAALMTAAITISVTAYAYKTESDFTIMGGLYFILSAALLMLLIFSIFTNNKFLHILLCVCGVCLYGLYIIYDTQIIVGKHEFKLDIDDYIYASFLLYVDIVNLFLYSLELLKLLSDDR